MRQFYTLASVCRISSEETDLICDQAEAGDPVACYKEAQLLLAWHSDENYAELARELLEKAQAGGVADADVALASMYFWGEIEPYDPAKGERLLQKALEAKNEYAAYFYLKNIIFGRHGYKQNLELADKTLDAFLADGENPYWYQLKGDVLFNAGRIVDSAAWYEKAVVGGVLEAYGDLALARGLDDNGEVRDWDRYLETLYEGAEHDPLSLYYIGLVKCQEYLDLEDEEEKEALRALIISLFDSAAESCQSVAHAYLGDMYREGLCDVEVDLQRAWTYYVEGSKRYNAACFEKMYEMLEMGEIELGKLSREEAMELCMVNGARLQSKRLLVAAVEAYKQGRLTRFASEMEMYHLPAYDAIPDDEPLDDEDEEMDDDGRFDAWA